MSVASETSSAPSPTPAPPTFKKIFQVWLGLGLQSFGGGGATLTLIRRAVVEQYGWVSSEDFAQDWALCQVAPGINLIALCILIGRRICGIPGIVACLVGLLLPSVTVTVVLTTFYARIRDAATVQSALRAVIPASVGLGFLTAIQLLIAPLKTCLQESRGTFVSGVIVVIVSAVTMLLKLLPVMAILAIAGGYFALFCVARQHLRPSEPKVTQ